MSLPQLGTYGLVLVNVLVFLAAAQVNHGLALSTPVLLEFGAISNDTLSRHEYWRLIAAAFLHLNPTHIVSNMVCLLSWGVVLEKRVGSVLFLVIYAAAAIAGNFASILGHQGAFVSAGASGAIFGLTGALAWFVVQGSSDVPARYLVSNLAFNGLLMSSNPQIDWMSHAGGFVAGAAVGAIGSLIARPKASP